MLELLILLFVLPAWVFSVIGAILTTFLAVCVLYWWQILGLLSLGVAVEVLWGD